MDNPSNPLSWAARAEEDYALAQSAIRRKIPLTYGATFHAQQTVEKYFKALLTALQIPFPRTHDLVALEELCIKAGVIIPINTDRLEMLNGYAVEARYPGALPTIEDAQEAIGITRGLRKFFRKRMGIS
jgi:HEPN domain-containing protein